VAENLADFLQRTCGNECGHWVAAAVSTVPVDLSNRDPVTVGGDEAKLVVTHLELDSSDDRCDIVARGGDANLGNGGRKFLSRYDSGLTGDLRDTWIFLNRHG
jgi:hypothetical protein